jgi:hypothetical protein
MGTTRSDELQVESEELIKAIKRDLDRLSAALPDNPTRQRAAALVQLGTIADKVTRAADRATKKAMS